MLVSQFLLSTFKEKPAEAELISHQLMLRCGMIRKLASGLYSWLPLGLRVLRKIETIVREEMNASGALELLMPVAQPAELWQESERWNQYGKELLKIQDRHQRDFCLGPTHEEVITDIARHELRSYKQLPLILYQIQTKFRDEIRPRFGVMRSREFLMKDAYSFDLDQESLNKSYQLMFDTYTRIFTRLQLKFRAVLADTGSIGGDYSHEFQVLADAGEDCVVYSDASDYAANIEKATAKDPGNQRPEPQQAMEKIATPGMRTIAALAEQLNIPATQSVKTLVVKGQDEPLIALILRGDHELNPIKAASLPEIAAPLVFATDTEILNAIGASPGSLGPVNLPLPVIVDRDAAVMGDFCCGANEDDYHFTHVNWQRDVTLPKVTDLRNVVQGDASPDGKGTLQFTRGIEVGQVFQLKEKYSAKMQAQVLAENGKATQLKMGCYGIGISRIVAAAIEQNHDQRGICWPKALAPFQVALVPMSYHKSYRVREAADKLYQDLKQAGIEVLMDDRKDRPGVMFADMDLIGIPNRLVISEKLLDQGEGEIEYKARTATEVEFWQLKQVIEKLS